MTDFVEGSRHGHLVMGEYHCSDKGGRKFEFHCDCGKTSVKYVYTVRGLKTQTCSKQCPLYKKARKAEGPGKNRMNRYAEADRAFWQVNSAKWLRAPIVGLSA